MLKITVGSFELTARLEDDRAPNTVDAFRRLLPLDSQLIQARWSGLGSLDSFSASSTSASASRIRRYPGAGEPLLYPGGVSETEILFPYGQTCFASKAGQLAGNHFATVVDGREHLEEIGRLVLWGRRAGHPLRGGLMGITHWDDVELRDLRRGPMQLDRIDLGHAAERRMSASHG